MHNGLRVLNSENKLLVPSQEIDYELPDMMKAGEFFSGKIKVNNAYGFPVDFVKFPPSTYRIQFIYKNKGYNPVKSNEIEIIVKEPIGDDIQVYEMLKQAFTLRRRDMNYYEAEKIYKRIVEEYPESIYTVLALRENLIVQVYFLKDRERVLNLSKKMIENYPDSPYAGFSIRHIKKCYQLNNDTDGGRAYLESIASKTMSENLKQVINEKLLQVEDIE